MTKVDVRALVPRERHPRIFQAWEALADGETMELINDHDPKPLLYQFQAEHWGRFDWSPLEEGPETWRIEIRKRPAGTARNRGVNEYMSWDHDRLEEVFSRFKGRAQAGDWNEAKPLYREFRAGLERHIRMEECVLFPAFEKATGTPPEAGPTAVMRAEHVLIRESLTRIEDHLASPDLRGLQALESRLFDVLAVHNQKEEGILYPWTDQAMDDRGRDDLVKAMMAA